jgi:DeoR family fructose operon transcriptional repressor
MAERMVEQYHATKAFIGADGVSLKQGLTTFDEKEASITSQIIASAEKVILLCDSSKIERNSYVKFAPLSVIDTLITDSDIPEEILNEYKNNGINILTSHDS